MLKSLLFIIIYQNDLMVEKYLKEEKTLDEITFFHTKHDLTKIIQKNAINIANFIRKYYIQSQAEQIVDYKKISDKTHHKLKKIVNLCIYMTSICINNPDIYLIGLRTLLDSNKVIYMNYI